ncbi:Uncharacterized protein TCM_005859 [Theobroma cacao]|uniref:Cystatin domain-containing protein n=1 Tax=Theobroma cacao TaxID=3641 RepID=A0A061DX99_THECC|nr:Uncharacterized protein TCM_005859 [Theobroma cacao]
MNHLFFNFIFQYFVRIFLFFSMAYPSDSDSDEARLDELYYGEADISNADLRKYNEQVKATGGYDVDDYPGFAIGKIFNIQLTQANHEELTPYAEKAINYFNEQNHANFKFLELLKANVQACCGVKYYLTFKVFVSWIKPNHYPANRVLGISQSLSYESGLWIFEFFSMASYLCNLEEEMTRLDVLYYGEADMSIENMMKYCAQVASTRGYDVDDYPSFANGLITPIKLDQAEY